MSIGTEEQACVFSLCRTGCVMPKYINNIITLLLNQNTFYEYLFANTATVWLNLAHSQFKAKAQQVFFRVATKVKGHDRSSSLVKLSARCRNKTRKTKRRISSSEGRRGSSLQGSSNTWFVPDSQQPRAHYSHLHQNILCTAKLTKLHPWLVYI